MHARTQCEALGKELTSRAARSKHPFSSQQKPNPNRYPRIAEPGGETHADVKLNIFQKISERRVLRSGAPTSSPQSDFEKISAIFSTRNYNPDCTIHVHWNHMTKPMPADAPRKKAKPTPGVVKPKSAAIMKTKATAQEKNFIKLRARAAAIGNSTGTSSKAIALKKDDRHLTEMQMMFVRHWAAGESILSASSRAGYADSGAMAYRLVKDPAIIKIYEREKKLYAASCQMTRAKVMEGFLEAAEMARLQADPTAMTGAWREVGKMCGFYEPVRKRIDINIAGNITTKVERLSDEDLLRIVKGEAGGEVLDALYTEFQEIENEIGAEDA